MALAAHQRISWALNGRPFGDYIDGDYNSATVPTIPKDSCSGTSGSNALSTTSATFANGEVLCVMQMRGTGVGLYEYVRVASGGGTTSLVLTKPLVNTYTDSGASQAQAVKVFRFRDVTIPSGSWSPDGWNQNVGGLLNFACKSFTAIGSISGTGLGFRGGPAGQGGDGRAYTGEGSGEDIKTPPSPPTVPNDYKNPTGSGGGIHYVGSAGGGNLETIVTDSGGGNIATGSAAYNAYLTEIGMGAGGGGGTSGNTNNGPGGAGGAIIMITAKTFNAPSGTIVSHGNTAPAVGDRAGSGGAGGCILIVGETVDIGTNKIAADYGNAGSGTSSNNNRGSYGRIAVYYSKSVAGSVTIGSGGYYAESDPTIKESLGGSFLLNFI